VLGQEIEGVKTIITTAHPEQIDSKAKQFGDSKRIPGGHIIDEHTMNYLKGVERTPPRDLQRQLDHWFKDGWAHLTEPPNQLKVAHFFRCIPPNIGNRVYIDRYKLAANNLAAAQHWIQLNDRCNKQTGAYPALKLPYPEVSTLHTMTQ
jgi:hypothetical protein